MNGYVCVIGATMLDVVGQSERTLIYADSNPGAIYLSPGGVSRNISENLARLGLSVELISVICQDPLGKIIQVNCEEAGISIQHSYYDFQHSTTTYSAFLEPNGKMHIALSDTRSLDQFPLHHIIDKTDLIKQAEIIVIDAALPEEILAYIFKTFSNKPIFVDPVSVGKAESLPNFINQVHTLKCNQFEATYLSKIPIHSIEDLQNAAQKFIDVGIQQVFITLGEEGVYYHVGKQQGLHPIQVIQSVNVTGAGDAFMAGLVYAFAHGFDLNRTLRFASKIAASALKSMSAVNPSLNIQMIERELEEEL
jgi:pseudouridine kinase